MKARDTIVNLRQKIANKHAPNEKYDKNDHLENKAHFDKIETNHSKPNSQISHTKQNLHEKIANVKARKTQKVCLYFLQNRCKFAENCYNLHPNYSQPPPTPLSNKCTESYRHKEMKLNTPNSNLDKSVIYEKTETNLGVETPSKREKEKNSEKTEVCPFYLENKCKFREKCKNNHPKLWQLNPEQKKQKLKHIPRLMSINPQFNPNKEYPSQPEKSETSLNLFNGYVPYQTVAIETSKINPELTNLNSPQKHSKIQNIAPQNFSPSQN